MKYIIKALDSGTYYNSNEGWSDTPTLLSFGEAEQKGLELRLLMIEEDDNQELRILESESEVELDLGLELEEEVGV